MFISFKCPHCGSTLQDLGDFAGMKSKCPKCKKKVIVPTKDDRIQYEAKEGSKEE
jgi:phage FluMu protein Com